MKETLRYLFQQKFNRDEYRRVVLQNLLHAQQLLREPQFLEETNDGDRIYGLGYLHDADGKEIGLYYTDVVNGDVRRKRVGFRQMMKPYVKYGADAAIAVFVDKEHWRLSYMCDLKGGETSAKRFSYVFGDSKGQYNTPSSRLADLGRKKIVLDDLKETFSVDALSKEFFDEYHRHYDIIINELKRQGFEGATIHDYVKKMMGRIVFLHFLQKKGWLNGNLAFLRDLFFFSPHQGDFLEQVLEPLFFGIFNTEKVNREQLFKTKGWDMGLLEDWKELPYLNGGLFERDAVDEQNITLPASLFEDLFTFMASYNFTVDENDPDDAEVGVDPEMLGKIFESLLEDNKAKGAFYTPKEIVRYMCKESLIAYLTTKTGVEKDENIRRFVETHEFPVELNSQREIIDQALHEVKICDPAIGSGAFPMGLLNELWRCREALEETASRVELKKEIIENNIYGVDIEKGAIDIARLRFWLSIVVDAENPEPLPNFDYKFMQGNSLIESFEGFDLSRISSRLRGGQSKSMQLVLGIDSHTSRQNLHRLLREYFSVTDHKKKAGMRQAINEEVKTLIRESIGGTPASLAKLEKMDCSANQDFFLWHTWFKDIFDNGGFDIVIGNPPYIQLQADGGKLGDLYRNGGFITYARTGDIYSLFYEQGWNLLCKGGHLCFITSNKWMRAGYGEKTREFFTTKTNPKILVDLGANVFENATVDTNILLYSKSTNHSNTVSVTFNGNSLEKLSEYVQQQGTICQFKGCESWVILSPIEQSIKRKIEAVGTPLKDWDIKINYGIKTGCNEAFIITTEKRDEILTNCQTDDERRRTDNLIRPILRGRDIKRYSYNWAELWLINTHNGVRGRIPRIDINNYPAVKQHLDEYWDAISSRADKGDTPYNLRNCAYLEEFDKPKLIFQEMVQESQFMFDDSTNYMCNDTCRIITGKDIKYLLAIMNSKLFFYAIKRYYGGGALGDNGVRMKHTFFQKFHCVQPNKAIIDLVEKLIMPESDKRKIEKEIDKLIYQLYNLTPEEIAIIEQ